MAEKKEKKYVSDNPQLMAEWNWEKNDESGFDPTKLTCSSGKKVWWKCKEGHEWQTVIAHKSSGTGCPYCSGRNAIQGVNDLQTVNPALADEWNYDKNNGLTPREVLANSHKKVWWKCKDGHEWQVAIADRNRGTGCPYCSGRYAIKGKSDLQTTNPDLANEWNYEKNKGLTPSDVMPNSNKKVWWKCRNGHEWQAVIYGRNSSAGCPYCAGQRIIKGKNDLQTVNPFLAKEWNYEKNNGLTPADVMSNSNIKVWWKCNKGHEWQDTVGHRNRGRGCPICNIERHTSFPEYAIVYYLEKCGLETTHLHRGKGYELDIYIPSKNIAIEYDGYLWHKNKEKKDIGKNVKCEKDGIRLYRIREGLPALNSSSIDFIIEKNQKDFPLVLKNVLKDISGNDVDVDLKRDTIAIANLREYSEKQNSILHSNPEIAAEWNYEKNGNLMPENFAPNSEKKVWWKCNKGHEWQSTIGHRNNGRKCPICSGKKVLKGYNDLSTINPQLAKEWNYSKNGSMRPEDFTANSGKKVWWICNKGHEWQTSIDHRNNGQGCPYCLGRYAIKGENDLQTVNPLLAKEWNYEKNNELTPNDVTSNSGKIVWWKCGEGHEWQARIQYRNRGYGCPICAKEKRKANKNNTD